MKGKCLTNPNENKHSVFSDCDGGCSDSDDDDRDKVVVVGVAAMVAPWWRRTVMADGHDKVVLKTRSISLSNLAFAFPFFLQHKEPENSTTLALSPRLRKNLWSPSKVVFRNLEIHTPERKNMDKVCEELDEVKAELEKVRAEYKSKAELCENLRKAHNEQLTKFQQASSKIEKQAQELNEKAEEISVAQQMCEELKCSLKDRESIVQHLRAANDKLRVGCDEKYQKLEDTNRVMKKFSEAEKKANAPKELRERDDVIIKLEEDNQKVQDQLKWKKEQFRHLEEAHDKLREQFKASKKEWEMEKSSLLDEICSLQTSLDSQTRISDDLQNRLQRCNQALAHEESRRKYLEVQVSEFQTRFEDVFSEREDAKSQLECLTAQRDKQIASLRQSLSTKETFYKEMEYQTGKLQQENQELRISLKELQEAQIQAAPGSPSLAKLRNKLKSLEQMHRDCIASHRAKEAEWSSRLESMTGELNKHKSELGSKDAAISGLRMELEQMLRDCTSNLKAKEYECSSQLEKMRVELYNSRSELESRDAALKELRMEVEQMHRDSTTNEAEGAEWNSQLEKMTSDVRNYLSELEHKDGMIKELKMELEACHSLSMQLKLENEELSVMLLVLKLGISEAQLKIVNGVKEECEKDELCLNQQVSQMESVLERELREVNDALERTNIELAEKICDGNEIEFELEIWKSIAERLRSDLEVSLGMRKELEASLLAQVDVGETIKQQKNGLLCIFEEKDKIIDNLQQKIVLLEQKLERLDTKDANSVKTETEMSFESENSIFLQIAREKDKNLEQLEKEISWLEQESLRIEFTGAVMAQIDAERTFEHEKEKLIQRVEQKYQRVNDLMQLLESLEHKFNCSLDSFSSQLAEKQAEIDLIHEAWEKITAAEVMAALEIEERKLMALELEEEICNIQQKLESQQTSLCESKQQALKAEAELETKELEVKRLTNQMKTKLINSDALIEELKSERRNLLEDVIKLSSEKENLLVFIGGLGDNIGEFSSTDKQLTSMLDNIMLSFDNKGSRMDFKWNDELVDPEQENVCTPTVMKISEAISDRRSPFRDLNN
ncbi:uncharacterized protein Pyn_04556 [Prunus yedoensis var. nudiflora]|uniref:Uncharacterized protein n=2 Tax=Prunus yedoensis var. nudiflora TaxID=2094558 RepID=A0A314UFS9_PRUYE|nr:uncharacterized protein Pyn_04556 [Prunus yedoensis var. nudiflora]